ncbi:MAG: hypothetical protein WD825_17680 [Gemmatimonadaceae bacterium]
MLKWIGGCLGLIVVVVGFGMWFGYRKYESFTSAPPISTVTILAPANRVFASIADADSMIEWRSEGLGIRSPRRGLLKLGDTLLVQSRSAGDNRPTRATWVVSALTPGKLLALEVRDDSTGMIMFTRRDSLVDLGDATQIVSTFAAPMLDSVRARHADSGGAARAMIGMGSKLVISAMRLQSDQELRRLKSRIEGRVELDSVPRPRQ